MSMDEEWIEEQFSKAKKAYPSITDDVITRTKGLFKGQLGDRTLTSTELKEVAKALIADMTTPNVPKTEAKNENRNH